MSVRIRIAASNSNAQFLEDFKRKRECPFSYYWEIMLYAACYAAEHDLYEPIPDGERATKPEPPEYEMFTPEGSQASPIDLLGVYRDGSVKSYDGDDGREQRAKHFEAYVNGGLTKMKALFQARDRQNKSALESLEILCKAALTPDNDQDEPVWDDLARSNRN